MNLWLNFLIISLTILLMVAIWFGLNYAFSKWMEPLGKWIGKRTMDRFDHKWFVMAVQVTGILVPIVYFCANVYLLITIGFQNQPFINYWSFMTLIFIFWVLPTTTYIEEYKKVHPEYKFIVIEWINFKLKVMTDLNKKNNRIYFINRVNLLFKQIPDLVKSIFILYFPLVFLTQLSWSYNMYFLGLFLIPFYGNYWVYYKKIFTVNMNSEEVLIRRICLYFLMFVYVTYELFIRYEALSRVTGPEDFNESLFVLGGSGVLYIAMDRVMKELTADYISYRKKINKNSEDSHYRI
ncbi:hypothetical protein [Paenibacillus sp. W2I17]|uniref:hypothetical protein n=1 Tax=Paenibacillus sp. W2I17 TaxID=3042311 RepID=UPI002787D095|nr:hypothetical protein [Paenibacillus sp. W2I17]MDQ0658392.1 hypothetical protein [Paenibacillus sp. W2I17]